MWRWTGRCRHRCGTILNRKDYPVELGRREWGTMMLVEAKGGFQMVTRRSLWSYRLSIQCEPGVTLTQKVAVSVLCASCYRRICRLCLLLSKALSLFIRFSLKVQFIWRWEHFFPIRTEVIHQVKVSLWNCFSRTIRELTIDTSNLIRAYKRCHHSIERVPSDCTRGAIRV